MGYQINTGERYFLRVIAIDGQPVLLGGLCIGAISAFILSFSQSYTLSFFARLLAGIFGSNSTVAKSMIGDIATTPQETAWGYSAYGAVFGFSGIVGPLISGILYDPATLYPSLFSKDGFYGLRPYALPCFFGAFLTLFSLVITYTQMKEWRRKVKLKRSSYDLVQQEEEALHLDNLSEPSVPRRARSTTESLLSPKIIAPIFLYCVIAFCSMVYMTAVPIYLSASRDHYGLGLSAQQTSLCTMIISLVKFPLQLYGFQNYVVYFKDLNSCYRSGMMALIPVHLLLPLVSILGSRFEISWVVACILILCMILIGIAEVLAYLSVIMLITESVAGDKDADMLGLVHGLASTCSACVRALSPPLAGLLWEMGKSPLVFGVNGVLVVALGIGGSMRLYP